MSLNITRLLREVETDHKPQHHQTPHKLLQVSHDLLTKLVVLSQGALLNLWETKGSNHKKVASISNHPKHFCFPLCMYFYTILLLILCYVECLYRHLFIY